MPKRAKGTAYHYRDTRTGRFVPKSTWKRSKVHAGKRYKREKQRPREEEEEYQINVKYKEGKQSKIEVQISAQGPAGKNRQEVIEAINIRRETGHNPQGWKIDIIEWRKASQTFKTSSGWKQLGFFYDQSQKKVK